MCDALYSHRMTSASKFDVLALGLPPLNWMDPLTVKNKHAVT